MNKKAPEIYKSAVPEIRPQTMHEDEIDLLELWDTVWRRRKFIFIFTSAVVVITAVVSLFMSNIYKAEATLLPISSKGGGFGGDMAGLASLAGINIGGGGGDANKIMVVANSRGVKEQVIRDLDLQKKIVEKIPEKRDPMQFTVAAFSKLLSIGSDKKTNVITISFEWKDPKLAAEIVNRYVAVLQDVLETKALSVDRIQRVFYERKLKEEKAKFSAQKHNMASFQKRSKMIEPAEQAKGTMNLYSALMSQKIALEMKVQGLEAALSPDNPTLVSVKNQLASLNKKIKSIEGNSDEGALPSLGNAPDRMIEYTDILQELKTSQGVYETLAKLYEKSKLDEAKNDLYVEVIDEAIVPDIKIKPKRSMMVAVAGMSSLFLSVFMVFLLEWFESVRQQRRRI